MLTIPEKFRLLHGPYLAPALDVGERATCILRGEVVITSWTEAPISWPRCQVPRRRGGCGLLLNQTLARAVRTESAAAIGYWWGVHDGAAGAR